jgi:thiosulfate dehydrogenase [quinone] large subunit
LVIAIGLILAWKVSGYIGLDYYLLPLVGTPWKGQPVENTAGEVPVILSA